MLNLPSMHGRLVNALRRGLPCTVSGVKVRDAMFFRPLVQRHMTS